LECGGWERRPRVGEDVSSRTRELTGFPPRLPYAGRGTDERYEITVRLEGPPGSGGADQLRDERQAVSRILVLTL
jgi:hypothetical protein